MVSPLPQSGSSGCPAYTVIANAGRLPEVRAGMLVHVTFSDGAN